MHRLLAVTLTGVIAAPFSGAAVAGQMNVTVDIPHIDVAEYHRPYVAIWVERADQTAVSTLSVWYDQHKPNAEGTKWLKDMRQWWRKAGRDLQMPADGISGATRAPGQQSLSFTDGQAPLAKLPPGEYAVVIEAAREVGGHELVRVPFTWPPARPTGLQAKGEHELGTISVKLTP